MQSTSQTLSSLHLDAFVALAQTQNFTRAARKLHITQSALSQRILNLEEELGCALFLRSRAGVTLTETARDLLRYCQTKMALEEEFLSKLKSKSSQELVGIVRIAGFSSVMRSVILPALSGLFAKFPNLQLQMRTAELYELPRILRVGEADFVILDHGLEQQGVETLRLGEEQNVLVERRGYKGADVYLDHDEEDELTLSYLKLAKRKVTRLQRRYLDDVYGLLDGVKLGLGRAVLPKHLLKGQPDIRIIEPETVLKIPVYLHYHRQPYYSRLHEAVVKELERGSGIILDG